MTGCTTFEPERRSALAMDAFRAVPRPQDHKTHLASSGHLSRFRADHRRQLGDTFPHRSCLNRRRWAGNDNTAKAD